MIKDLVLGDTILVKPLNILGFVCDQNFPVYFVRQEVDFIVCSLQENLALKKFIKVKDHQINSAIDSITGLVKYEHNPSDGL